MENMDNPITFDAVDIKFEHSNEQWALAHLPQVRIASILVNKNERDITETIDRMAKQGIAPELLDGLIDTRDHLKAIVEFIDVALARSFYALDRLGYTPDDPPTDERVH